MGFQHVPAAAVSGNDDLVSNLCLPGGTQLHCWCIEPSQRLHKAESRRLVIADDMGRSGRSFVGHQPHPLRLGAQDGCGERIVGNLRPKRQDGRQSPVELEGNLVRFRLCRRGKFPFTNPCHR